MSTPDQLQTTNPSISPAPPLPDERVLILQSETRDPTDKELAFASIVVEFEQPLQHYARRYLAGSPYSPEDIVQDTFLRAWKGIGGFEPRNGTTSLRGWLYRIAHNLALNSKRDNRHDATSVSDEIIELTPSRRHDPAVEYEFHEGLSDMREHLPRTQYEALLLRSLVGLSWDEIAEAQSTTPTGAKSRISRGRSAAKHILSEGPPVDTKQEAIAV